MGKIIGFTTTIPFEILFAGGYIPCDLNNIFITDSEPMHFIEKAEMDGFHKSMCNWIKGIYGVLMEKDIDSVIAVMEGDCSNTQALAEILQFKGIHVIPFSYPYDRDRDVIRREIDKLMGIFGVDYEKLKTTESEIEDVREILRKIDRMTWDDNLVTGYENHLWLVRSSDMLGDYRMYHRMAKEFIDEARKRRPIDGVRIGFIGVPPIVTGLYEFIEDIGGHVVYNETQRQFSMPFKESDIVERYRTYTYPYGIFSRLHDIKTEIKKRDIKGIIHYVQAFCYRVMEDVILRQTLDCPILTIEGELPRPLDARLRLRLEAFIEMLRGQEG
ncbi:MAG: 2-hydroxyacyl-CoA dehydratase [Syntrophorhabdaceae bacterium]|nr:2-hydroxyacyl-CoA dehydratase [Syntrophorhabdaceae bacterium]